jgi:hypothetical protein
MPLAPLNVEDYTHKELGRTIAPKTKVAIIEASAVTSLTP